MKLLSKRIGVLIPTAIAAALAVLSSVPAHAQNGTWSSITGFSVTPGLRRENGVVFDQDNQRFLLFDGRLGDPPNSYVLSNDVWALSVAGTPEWSLVNVSDAVPGPRHGPQWGYDPARNRVLVFGGYGSHYPGWPYEYLNDVWELSLNDPPHWTELFPTGQTPSGRLAGAAVYDPMRQRFVGFGGTINQPVDTWVLNLQGDANWDSLPVPGDRPLGGYGMTSVYDAREDRLLIFGGSTSDDYYGSTNDVWELKLRDARDWRKIETTGARPIPRRSGAAVFDALRNRMVIYGGFDAVPGSDQFVGDTWALDFNTSPPAWTELSPAGTLPHGRDAVAGAYDPVHDRMIMYGGWSGTEFLGDTQFLDWGGTTQAAQLTASSSATPASANVQWTVQGATTTHAAVYRRTGNGPWTARALAEVDGSGHVAYNDGSVQAGQSYSYMMVVGSHRGETFGGQALVQVPSSLGVGDGPALTFALNRIAPNPAVDRMSVSYTLTSSEPVTLDLLDVSGRRVLSQDLGAPGAGTHRFDLTTGDRVTPGLYFVRLAQAGRVATSRVVISGRR